MATALIFTFRLDSQNRISIPPPAPLKMLFQVLPRNFDFIHDVLVLHINYKYSSARDLLQTIYFFFNTSDDN